MAATNNERTIKRLVIDLPSASATDAEYIQSGITGHAVQSVQRSVDLTLTATLSEVNF